MTLLLSRDALVAAAAGRLYDEALAALAEVGPDFYDPGYDVEIAEDLNGSFAEDTDVNHLASIGMALALNMPVIGWQPAVRNAGEDDRADRAARQFANAALVLISDFTAGHIGQQEFTTGLSAAYLRQARNAYLAGKRALGNLAPLTVDDEQVIARTLAAVGLDPNSPTPRASLGGLLAMLVNATNSATPAARRAGVALNDALDSYTKRLMAQLVRRGFTVAQGNLQRDIDRLVNNAATGNAQAQAALAQVAHVADTGQVGIAAQHAAENRRRATIEVQRFEAKMKAARDLLAAEIQAQIAVSEKQVAARLTQIRAQLLDGKIEPAEAAAAVMALLNTRARRAYASGRRLAGIRGPLSDEDLLNIQQEQDDAANDFLAAVPEVAVAGSMIGGIAKMILSPWNLVDPDVAKWLWRKVTGVSNEYNALKNAGERGAFALGGEPAPVVGRPPATDVADVVAPVGPPPPPHPATALESVTQVWWQLDPAAQHCQDCLTLSDKSPYYLEQLNAMGLHPGSGHTQCMTRCRCRLQFDVPAMVCGDVLNGSPSSGDVAAATTCAMPIPVQSVRPVDPDADTVIGDMPDAASDQAFNWDSDITKRIQTVVSAPGLEGFTWLRRFVRRESDAVTRTFTIPDTGLTYQAVIEDAPDAVRFLTGKMAADATLEHEFSVHAMQWAAQRAAERGVPLEFDQSLINPGMAQFLRDVGARSSEFTPVADVIRAGAPSAVETIVPVPGFNLPALPDGVTIPKQRYVSNGRGIMQTGFVPSASKADAIERLYAVFPNAALTPKARAGFSLEQIDQIVAKGELFQTIGLDTSLLREIDRLPATSGHAGIAYSGGRLTLKANPGLAGLSTTADSFGDLFAHEYGHLVSREATGHGGALADELENIYWRNEGRLTKYADGDPKEMFSEAFALMTRPGYKAGDVIGDTEAWSLLQDRGIWTPVGRPTHLVSGEPVGQTLGRAIEGLPDPADFQNIKESGVLHQYHPADLVELLKDAPDDQIAAAEQLFRNAVTAWKKDPTVVPNDWYIWNVKGGLFTPGSLDNAPHVPSGKYVPGKYTKYEPPPPKPPMTPFAGDSYDVAGAPTDEMAIAGSDVKLNTPLVEWSGSVPVEPPVPTLALTKETKDALREKANAAWLGWQDVESGTTPYAVAWGKAETDAATQAGLLVEKLKDGTYYVAGDDAHMAALRKAVDGGLDTGSDQFWIDWLGYTRERLDAIDAYEAAKKSSKSLRAGVIVREPDGRLWFIAPKNQFAGYENTWSKGGVDAGETTAQAAVREIREEMGLSVELDAYLGDFTSTDGGSLTRYYIGHRTGGGPAFASEKETHAIRLGTPEQVRPVLLHYGKLDSRDTAVLDTYLEHEGLPPVAPADPVLDAKAAGTLALPDGGVVGKAPDDLLGFTTDDLPAKMPPHATVAWAEKEWTLPPTGIAPKKVQALDAYVKTPSFNSLVHNGKVSKSTLDALDDLLTDHPVPKDITVTRGMEVSAFDVDAKVVGGVPIGSKVDIGHVFTAPVYLSTTVNEKLATDIPDNIVAQHGAIVRFHVPAGTPAYYVPAVKSIAYPAEDELLLGRGLSYRATKAEQGVLHTVDGDMDVWFIDAEILPPANAGKVAAIADHPALTIPAQIGYDVADADAIAGLYYASPTTPSGVVKEWKFTTADGHVGVSMMESPMSQNFIAAIDAIQPQELGGLIAEQQHKTLLAGTLLGVLKNAPAGKKVSVALHDATDAEILKPLLTATNTVVSGENNLILQPDEVVKVINALSNGAVRPPGQLSVNAAAATTLASKLSPVDPQSAAAAAVPSVSTSHFAPGVTNAPEPPKSLSTTYGFDHQTYLETSSDASADVRAVELHYPSQANVLFPRTQTEYAVRISPPVYWGVAGQARMAAVLRALHDEAERVMASPTLERVRYTDDLLAGTPLADFFHAVGATNEGAWHSLEKENLPKLIDALDSNTLWPESVPHIPTAALDPAAQAHVVDSTLSHMPTAPGQWATVNVPKTAMSTKYEYGNSVLKQWSDAQPTPIMDTAALQHPPLDQVGTPMKVYDAHTQVYAYGTVPGAEGKITFHWDVATGGNLRINDVVLEGGPGAGAVASAWLAQMRQFAAYMKSPQFGKAEHLAVRINSALLSDPLLMPVGLTKMLEERGLKFSVFGGATLGRKNVIDLDFDLGKDLEAALPGVTTPEAAVQAAQSVGGAFAVADAQGAVDSATLLAQEWGGVHDVLAKHYQTWAVGPFETHPATIGQGYTDVYTIDPLMPQYKASVSYFYPDAFGSPGIVRIVDYTPTGVSDKIVTVAAASTFRNLAKQGKIIEYSPVALGKVSEPLRDLFASYAPTPAGSPGLYRLSAAKVNNALALLDNKVGALVPAAINTPPVVAAPTGFLAKLGTSTDAWHNTAAEWEHTGGGLQIKMTFPSGGYVENGLIGLNDADQWIIHPDIFDINAAVDGDHALAYATAVRLFNDAHPTDDLYISIQTLANNSPPFEVAKIKDLFAQLGAQTEFIAGPGLSYRLTPDIQQALIDSFENNALGVAAKAPTTDVYAEMLGAYGMTVPQSSKQLLADSLVTPGKPGLALTQGTGASESLSWTTPLGDMSVDFHAKPEATHGLLGDVHGANQAEYYAAALLGLNHMDALDKGVVIQIDLAQKLPGLKQVLIDKYGAVDQFGLVQMDAAQVHTLVADLKNGLNLAVPSTPMPNPVTAFGATVAVPVATPPPSAAAGAASGNFALLGPDYNPVGAQQWKQSGKDVNLHDHPLLSGTNTTMKASTYQPAAGGDVATVTWRRLGNRVELWGVSDGNPNAFAAWVRDTTHYLNMNPKIEAVVLKAPYQGTSLDPIRKFLFAYKTGGGDLNPVVDRNTWNLMNVQMDKDAIAAAKAPVAAPAHQAFESVVGYDAQAANSLAPLSTGTVYPDYLHGTNTALKSAVYSGGDVTINWRRLGNSLEIHHIGIGVGLAPDDASTTVLAHLRQMAALMDASPKLDKVVFQFPAELPASLAAHFDSLGGKDFGQKFILPRESVLKIRDLIKADAGIVVAPPPIVYSVIGQTLVPEALSYDPKFIAKAVPSDTFTKTASYLSGTNTTIKHTHYADAADMEWRRLGNRLETWGYYGGPQPPLQNATFWAHVRHIANELDASPKLEGWSYRGEISELPIQIEQLLVNEFGAVQTETGLRMTREQVLKVRQMLDYDLQQVYDLQQGATTAFVPGSVTFTPVPKPVPGVPIIVGPQADLMAKVIAYTPKESKTYGNPLLLPPKKIGSQGFSTIKAEWTNYDVIWVGNYWPHNAAPYSGEYLPVWLGSLYHIAGKADSLGKDLIIPKTIQGVTDADYQAIILPLLGAANATLEGTSSYNMKYRVASSQASKLRDLLKANELPPGTKPAPAVSAATTAAAASTAYTPPPPQPLPVYKPKPKPLPPTIDINAPIPTLTDIASPTYVPPAVSHTLVSKATGPQIPDAAKLSKQFGYNNIDVQSLLALGSSESEIGELTLPGATKTALARRSSWLTAEGVKVDAQWAASPGGSVVAFTNMLPAPGVSAGQQTASFWASLADFAQKTATKVTDDGAAVTNARLYVTKEIYDSRPELRQMLLDLGGTEFLERPEHGAQSGFGAAFDAFGPGIRLDRQQSKVLADALATNTRDVALQGQVLAATPPPPVFKAVPQGVVANQPFRYFGIDPDNLYLAGTEVIRADGLGAVSEWARGKVQADWLRTPSTLQWRNLRIAGDPTVATVNASVMRSLDSLLEDLATHPGMALDVHEEVWSAVPDVQDLLLKYQGRQVLTHDGLIIRLNAQDAAQLRIDMDNELGALRPAGSTLKPVVPAVIWPDPHELKPFQSKLKGQTRKGEFLDAQGNHWLFKPGASGRGTHADVAVSDLAQLLGLRVPKVREYEFEVDAATARDLGVTVPAGKDAVMVRGELQKMVPGVHFTKAVSDLTPDQVDELFQHKVLDWVVANDDAHIENFLIDGEGHLWGIDKTRSWVGMKGSNDTLDPLNHGQGGPGLPPLANLFWRDVRRDPAVLQRITPKAIAKTLGHLNAIPENEFLRAIRPVLGDVKLYPQFHSEEEMRTALVRRLRSAKSDLEQRFKTEIESALKANPSDVPQVWKDWLNDGAVFRPSVTRLEQAEDAMAELDAEFGQYSPSAFSSLITSSVFTPANKHVTTYVHGSGLVSTAAGKAAGAKGYGADVIPLVTPPEIYERYTRLNQWALLHQVLDPRASPAAHDVDISSLRRAWNPDTGTIRVIRGTSGGSPDAYRKKIERQGLRSMLGTSVGFASPIWGSVALMIDVPWENIYTGGTLRAMLGSGEAEFLVRDVTPDMVVDVRSSSGGRYGAGPWGSFDDFLKFQRA